MADRENETADVVAMLDAFAAAYNRHDVDGIMHFMTDDCVFGSYFGPEAWGDRFVGTEKVRARVASFLKDFPDARWSDVRHFVSGNRAVSEWTFTGTRLSTGERSERQGCDVFTLKDGKIQIKDTYQKWRMPVQGREEVSVPGIHDPVGRYAHAVRQGNLLYVSGCGGFDRGGQLVGLGDITAQTEQTYANIGAILEAAGSGVSKILKETVYLSNIEERLATRPVRDRFYGSILPACTLVEISRFVHPDMKIEVDIVASV